MDFKITAISRVSVAGFCLAILIIDAPKAFASSSSGGISTSGETCITLESLQIDINNLRAELNEERNRRVSLEAIMNEPKVAFYARVTPTIVGIEPWATIVFSHVDTNIGEAYNNTSGEFVVPTTGVYVFFCNILSASGKIIETTLQINGKPNMLLYSGGKYHGSGSNMAVLQLNVGDVVKMVKHGPWGSRPFTVHHWWSSFSGYLLQNYNSG